jgi:hypothetical protein
MSAEALSVLARDPKLFADFKSDPIGTLKIIEQMIGSSLANISVSDIALIKTFTPDEFQVFVSVSKRMAAMNKRNFTL